MVQRDALITLPLATVVYPCSHPLVGQLGVVNAFLVRHPAGPLLVDTGIGGGNAEIDRLYQPVRRPLADALAEHGVALSDIHLLINTHLHFDHCGGNALLPEVRVLVQAAEYAASLRPGFTIPEWVHFRGARYRQVDGETEIAPGVRLLPTPGHTPGHQSVLIEGGDGLIIIAGQALQSRAEYDSLQTRGVLPPGSAAPDLPAYEASARMLVDCSPRRVYFSHDPAVWDEDDRPA
jgi:glyoxylase-like metal-dependent hydrolase (beta-lactamase superfamily II)